VLDRPIFEPALIFTASPSPDDCVTGRRCDSGVGPRPTARLRENFERLHAALSALGYRLGAPPSPVIAVVLGDKAEALRFWSELLARGVYVNLMLPPATPDGVSLIRCSVSAAHTSAQIDAVCAAFAALRSAAGIAVAECDTKA
jgi:8-amino-7-oxononanoate synthase